MNTTSTNTNTITLKICELTDEEIDSLIMEVPEKPTDEDLYDFAKAILRKVSE